MNKIDTSDITPSVDPRIPLETIPLRPEEKLISAKLIESKPPKHPLKPLEALQLLAGVTRPGDIGTTGPLVASRAFPENAMQEDLRLYEVVFGRDSLIVASFLLEQFPTLARTTLLRLAALQGIETHLRREEDPGKIVHEARLPNDPIAKALTAKRGWEWPYFGSLDATPLFIQLLTRYVTKYDFSFLRTSYRDRSGQTKTIEDALEQALYWLLTKIAGNAEGLIESHYTKPARMHNQVWKDSPDSYCHADGRLADSTYGIASVEVQAYAFDALQSAISLYKKVLLQEGLSAAKTDAYRQLIQKLAPKAEHLRKTILNSFWVEDSRGGYFALGSERDKQGMLHLLKVRTSNMGHLLDSGIFDATESIVIERRDQLVATLFSQDMLNSSGIRTLSALENRFRPNSYHNGSVWLWDTFKISLGLLRQGYHSQAYDLWQRIAQTAQKTQQFPEFVSGGTSAESVLPKHLIKVFNTQLNWEYFIEQPPQEIQAWTVAAVVVAENQLRKMSK